ncbi:mitogen-activated protein kinase kinase kinase 1-like isoform X1 [Canna indica]|uniref:mitogen-activated protein kinase kinase kinase n=1 Tax=Canna indica TaxID=4628 RepID=A0AAQ3KIV1_9LILI|nr:mitogen-activated protein kinase kinase kinase 1-like isoform X1 [Canna indica]
MLFRSHKRSAFRSGRGEMESKQWWRPQEMGRRPRLQRRNAAKNFDYEVAARDAGVASWSLSPSLSSSSSASADELPPLRATRSLDLPFSEQTSFRIGGSIEGEVDILCRILGLSGPEDFAIPINAWEARTRSSSNLFRKRSPLFSDCPTRQDPALVLDSNPATEETSSHREVEEDDHRLGDTSKDEITVMDPPTFRTGDGGAHGVRPSVLLPPAPIAILSSLPINSTLPTTPMPALALCSPEDEIAIEDDDDDEPAKGCSPTSLTKGGDGGIRGVRPSTVAPPPPMQIHLTSPVISALPTPPPVLAPPPSMSLPAMERMSSAWDIVRSFAPDEEDNKPIGSNEDEEELTGAVVSEEELVGLRLGETLEGITGTSSYSMMYDDGTSSMSTETMFIISPNGKFKCKINSWMRGTLLGRGSYGVVYEGISEEGVFFAVKEVSLLDQGNNAHQCLLQLEQEIALLSQFEHENIVRYYGTDKEEAKLLIFLELVTQGSLASLYQKYNLQETQVSSYTRQILYGLSYLHERNVVHRDIKCANILVHANGSVKLADFGLAKEITKFNMLKSCKGSVYWMAPEVVNPRKTYGPACDIWSLGCTVLEMLTCQIPYPNLEWTQALFRIGRGEQPPIPNHLSRDARDFIRKCVRVNPDDRPSASQLLEHPFVKRSLSVSTVPNFSTRY